MTDSIQKAKSNTRTTSFGVSKRESHDSSKFYELSMMQNFKNRLMSKKHLEEIETSPVGPWANQIYLQSAEKMSQIPDNSIGLAFTSPPYNVAKEYDENLSIEAYFSLINQVGKEVYRVLKPGGRYVINIANLGRKPYIPMHAYYYQTHSNIGFLPMGEIIWQKAKGANGSCAWGSWMSAKSPRLRDLHEYLLVFSKHSYSRPDKGESTIDKEEFMAGTLSVWDIPPVSAKRIGHPAPFPLALADRVIDLFSYQNDVILDPFSGSGTTLLSAFQKERAYVGFEIEKSYVELTQKRFSEIN